MRTVGVVTTFRQPNYGSVLQAYSTQIIIEKLGYKCELIDYLYPNDYHHKKGLNWSIKPVGVKRKILQILKIRKLDQMTMINRFIKKNIHVSIDKFNDYNQLIQNPPIYDIYLTGSDQIWNPNTMYGDLTYFLAFAKSKNKISYSSSFSCSIIPQEYIEMYKTMLTTFSSLSVREFNGQKIINDLIGIKVKVVLDPTLLLDKNYWKIFASKIKTKLPQKKYIFYYELAYTYSPTSYMNQLLIYLQKENNYEIVFVNKFPSDFDSKINHFYKDCSVFDFINLITGAACVVTSSFHGTAFALNFGKPLYSVVDNINNSDDRISSIISQLGVENCLVKLGTSFKDLNPYYDINKEQLLLQECRQSSLNFLENALNINL